MQMLYPGVSLLLPCFLQIRIQIGYNKSVAAYLHLRGSQIPYYKRLPEAPAASGMQS